MATTQYFSRGFFARIKGQRVQRGQGDACEKCRGKENRCDSVSAHDSLFFGMEDSQVQELMGRFLLA